VEKVTPASLQETEEAWFAWTHLWSVVLAVVVDSTVSEFIAFERLPSSFRSLSHTRAGPDSAWLSVEVKGGEPSDDKGSRSNISVNLLLYGLSDEVPDNTFDGIDAVSGLEAQKSITPRLLSRLSVNR